MATPVDDPGNDLSFSGQDLVKDAGSSQDLSIGKGSLDELSGVPGGQKKDGQLPVEKQSPTRGVSSEPFPAIESGEEPLLGQGENEAVTEKAENREEVSNLQVPEEIGKENAKEEVLPVAGIEESRPLVSEEKNLPPDVTFSMGEGPDLGLEGKPTPVGVEDLTAGTGQEGGGKEAMTGGAVISQGGVPVVVPVATNVYQVKRGGFGKKLLLVLLMIAILGGLAWFGWTFWKKRQVSKEKTLVYWGLWEDGSILTEVVSQWEKGHPGVKVKYVLESKEEYRERLQSALARNEGPDIFRYHNTWLPMLKSELATVPTSVLTSSDLETFFYPTVGRDLVKGGSYYGIPLEIDTLALFANTDIFKRAGLKVPGDWNELKETAFALTKGGVRGVALGTTSNVMHWSDILGLMMLQNGADLTKPTGELAEQALYFYSLFKTGGVWDESLPNSTLAFSSGKLAMYFGYSWDVFEIWALNKQLPFEIYPVPQLPGREEVNWASYWVEGVSSRSKNQTEAWEFLGYLSSPEVMEKLYQAQAKIRGFGEPYSRVEMAQLLADNPWVVTFLQQAVTSRSWYLCSRTFDNGINDRMIKYFEDAVNSVNKGGQAKDALEAASQGVSQILGTYSSSGI